MSGNPKIIRPLRFNPVLREERNRKARAARRRRLLERYRLRWFLIRMVDGVDRYSIDIDREPANDNRRSKA